MSAFVEACIELQPEKSLVNETLGVTVHKFDDNYWLLWNKPEHRNDLGRILTEEELQMMGTSNFTDKKIGIVLNIQTLDQRKEWFT